MSSREYVFLRRSWISAEEDAIVIVNKSVEHPHVPEGRKYVRVQSYFSEMVLRPHSFSDEVRQSMSDSEKTCLYSGGKSWAQIFFIHSRSVHVPTVAVQTILKGGSLAILGFAVLQETGHLLANI